MTRKSRKDDLFRQRMIPGVDFDECIGMFALDVHDYLTAHSADFRRWDYEDEVSFTAEELNWRQRKAYDRLLAALCSLEAAVTDRLWSLGMLAAVFCADTPSYDVVSFLAEEVKDYKTEVYIEAAETLELEYDAMKESLPPSQHARLAKYRKNQRQAIRMKAIASALHGVEWTVQALKQANRQVEEDDLNRIYLFFDNL